MPTYGYVCEGCGHSFDKISKVDDRNIPLEQPCPQCGEVKLRMQFGSTPVLDPYRMGLIKPDQGFRDVLRNIKHRTPGATFDIN